MSAIFPQNLGNSLVPLPLRTSSYHQDPLLYVDRQAKHIQRNLQALIDAQSEGLLAGLGGRQPDGTESESHASVSEPASPKGVSTVPVRQPAARKIGLRAAREGIFTSMYELLKLRVEEREILDLRVEERDQALNDIEVFNTKRAGLEASIAAINASKESQRSRELRDESSRLEAEIHDLETKLSQMKARRQHVVQELSQIENSVESKLSSYRASLSLLESDIQRFLANPPVKPQANRANQDNFYLLKPSRRSLGMAEEHWKAEQSELRKRQTDVDAEIDALEDGGDVWKRTVEDISGFEKRLKAAMRRSLQTRSQLLEVDGPSGNKGEVELVRTIMDDLAQTADRVERHLEHADERNWKLLVCCISAELQALREARELLLSVFNVTEEDIWPRERSRNEQREESQERDNESQIDPLGVDNPDPPADLLRDMERQTPDPASRSEDEDDEPDPAWLLPDT